MDELIIDDKKYVSSKRAAKMTGYAKDYVGQLCREGRVTARLVGRSWYVLESAIHDHRFTDKQPEHSTPSAAVFSSTWGSPRYEATPVEALKVVEKEHAVPESPYTGDEEAPETMAQHLQDSWKAWFDRVGDIPAQIPDTEAPQPETEIAKMDEKEEEEAVNVPIRAIYHPQYQPLPHELLPRKSDIAEVRTQKEEYEQDYPRRKGNGARMIMQLAGVLVAVLMAVLAVAGSGYFDRYILANGQFGAPAGVSFYSNK